MTNASGLIRQRVKKTYFSVSRVPELDVIFMKDLGKVLINVPIESTPFLFQACRAIPGTKPEFVTRRRVLSIPVIAIEMTRWRGSSVSKSSVSILREGSVFRAWCEKWLGTCKLICGQSHVDARFWRHSWHSGISGMAYRLSSDSASH